MESLSVGPQLGSEDIFALLSDRPLEGSFLAPGMPATVGGSESAGAALVAELERNEQAGTRIARRQLSYTVAAPPGETEYTVRAIRLSLFKVIGEPSLANARTSLPSRVEFEFGSDRLTDRGRRDLDVFGAALAEHRRDINVVLEGHTDDIGTDDYNLALSQRRADAVKRYLTEGFALDASRIEARGLGKAAPVTTNATDADRGRNRRVDFVFSAANTK